MVEEYFEERAQFFDFLQQICGYSLGNPMAFAFSSADVRSNSTSGIESGQNGFCGYIESV